MTTRLGDRGRSLTEREQIIKNVLRRSDVQISTAANAIKSVLWNFRGRKLPSPFVDDQIRQLVSRVDALPNTKNSFGILRILKMLLKHGGNPNVALGRTMRTLNKHNVSFVNQLIDACLKAGANPNTNSAKVRESGLLFTPLHVAAEMGDASTIRLLTRAGANVNARLTAIGEYMNDDLPLGARRTPLHEAVRVFNVSTFDELLKPRYKALINAEDARGTTPLHVAIIYAPQFLARRTLNFEGTRKNERHHRVVHVIDRLMKAGADPYKKMLVENGYGDLFPASVLDLAGHRKMRYGFEVPNDISNMLSKTARVEARRHLDRHGLPDDIVQSILHKANLSRVSEYSPRMRNQMVSNRRQPRTRISGTKRSRSNSKKT